MKILKIKYILLLHFTFKSFIMIEQLFNLIQQESQQQIIDNPSIPNEQNKEAMGLATESIFGGLQNALANGNFQDVMNLFGGKTNTDQSNPLVSGISDNFVGGLMQKFGLDNSIAKSIAASIIPMVIGKMISKTNDSGDSSFDINNIIGSLIGSKSGGSGIQLPGGSGSGIDFGGILKNITSGGLDTNHDGKVGLDDVIGLVTGAASNAQQTNQQTEAPSSGGIFGMLKGLIGS